MKKINFLFLLMVIALMAVTMVKPISVSAADSIKVTIYADCRDVATWNGTDEASLHNISQRGSYDPSVLYITGHWTPPTEPGKGDWTFIKMDSVGPHIFKAVFKYGVGHFAGNTADDPDLLADRPGWYFAFTNDWSTNEWVPSPCNVAWNVQRIFVFDISKSDTTVAFKYGVCEPVKLSSLGIGLVDAVSVSGISSFSVQPNPATNLLNITNGMEINMVKMYDITGKLVKEVNANGSKEITVSLNGMPSQLYVLQVHQTDGKILTTKVSKR